MELQEKLCNFFSHFYYNKSCNFLKKFLPKFHLFGNCYKSAYLEPKGIKSVHNAKVCGHSPAPPTLPQIRVVLVLTLQRLLAKELFGQVYYVNKTKVTITFVATTV